MKLGPETYGWFYSHVNLGVAAVFGQTQDTEWFRELRAAGLDKEEPLSHNVRAARPTRANHTRHKELG